MLPTQQISDPPICGREALAVLDALSKSAKTHHKAVHEFGLK